MNETQNTVATPVPEVVAKPIATAKPKRTRKPKAEKPPGVTLAIANWQHTVAPALAKGSKVKVLERGENTGRLDKLNQPIKSKSLVLTTPNNKDLGMTGENSLQAQRVAGKQLKEAVAPRIVKAIASDTFIVRRYAETPGKRNKIAVTFEQFSEVSAIAKLAAELGKPESEVRKALGLPEETTIDV